MACVWCCRPNKGSVLRCFWMVLQLAHFLMALSLLCVAVVEFSAEAPLFDVLGTDRQAIPQPVRVVFQHKNVSAGGSAELRRVMDLPILGLFFVYFLAVVWLKCRGAWSWLLTSTLVGVLLVILTVNLWAGDVLQWKYFSSRSVAIIINVLTIALAWSVVIVVLLNIRNWFPFKIKKTPITTRLERVVVSVWNVCALSFVLTLCLLIWFSRLYNSWACVRSISEVLLLCQFTNLVQCWQCVDAQRCSIESLENCVLYTNNTFHCLSPVFTLGPPQSAFCVFNYNIGGFTFLIVFSYVGGIYFFMRTTLNAFVKCIVVLAAILLKWGYRLVKQRTGSDTDSHHSLLVSLPKTYSTAAP